MYTIYFINITSYKYIIIMNLNLLQYVIHFILYNMFK